jgi:hypothetical protein
VYLVILAMNQQRKEASFRALLILWFCWFVSVDDHDELFSGQFPLKPALIVLSFLVLSNLYLMYKNISAM